MSNTTYCVEYLDYRGKRKIHKDKTTGGIKEFVKYTNALKLKNWFQDKGFEEVVIKEIRY